MQRYRNILVGVDLASADRLATSHLAPPTRAAVENGIWLAARNHAALTFLAAIDVSAKALHLLADEEQKDHIVRTVEEEANRVLDELVQQAKSEQVEAEAVLVWGSGWLSLIERVLAHGHDLVVVGNRHHSAAARLFLGSTAMKLLRKCPCAVWVTQPGPIPETPTLLAATDLTDMGQEVLHAAVDTAQLLDARLHILHVVEDPLERRMWLLDMSDERLEERRKALEEESERLLHEQLSHTDYRSLYHGVKVHVRRGQPEVVILDAIEEFGVDLFVMGTHGRGGIPGLLVGNTAERLLPHLNCSLLAIKPHDFVCPIRLDETGGN